MADVHELAGRLDHELPDVRWDEPEQIRSRGRDRTRRRSMVLAAVSVLAVAAGAGWLAVGIRAMPAGPPAPASTPVGTPSATPAAEPPREEEPVDGSTLFPKTALLQPTDVGAGYQSVNEHGYAPGSYPTWWFADNCPAYDGLRISAFKSYLWFRHANLEKSGSPTVFVEGSLFPPGMATKVVADIDRVTTACASWAYEGGEATSEERPGTTTRTYAVLAKDFAGDEARLARLRWETNDPDGVRLDAGSATIAAVRVGDRVTFVMMEQDDPERLRLLGERAADRLCAADERC